MNYFLTNKTRKRRELLKVLGLLYRIEILHLFRNKNSAPVKKQADCSASFETLYTSHKSMVFGIALRYLRCREDANDVVQEAFINAFTHFEQYDPEKPFEPWLKRITINTALMFIRKNYRYKLIENERELDATFRDTIEEEKEAPLSQQDLINILQELPNGYRMVFNLYAIDGLTHQEIADYLEITESTSRTQLLKARKMIKGILERKMITLYERA